MSEEEIKETRENEHIYKIKYVFSKEIGEFKAEDIKNEGKGGCDAYFLVSIIYPEDGSYSLAYKTCAPDGTELSPSEEFKAWLLMGKNIAEKLQAADPNDSRWKIADMPMRAMFDFFKLREEEKIDV